MLCQLPIRSFSILQKPFRRNPKNRTLFFLAEDFREDKFIDRKSAAARQ